MVPQRLVAAAGFVDLGRVEQLALGEHVGDVDGEAGVGGADVEHVPGAARERHMPALEEDRDDDAVVGAVRRAVVGMVVQDDVAGGVAAGEALLDAAHIGGERSAVHRRRIAFADLAPIAVEDAGADVLRLAHDVRPRHADQQLGHLVRDRAEGAADHLQGDGIDLDAPPQALARGPLAVAERRAHLALGIGHGVIPGARSRGCPIARPRRPRRAAAPWWRRPAR